MPSGIRPPSKTGYIPKRRYETPLVNFVNRVVGCHRLSERLLPTDKR